MERDLRKLNRGQIDYQMNFREHSSSFNSKANALTEIIGDSKA